jgi:hypothetical protein
MGLLDDFEFVVAIGNIGIRRLASDSRSLQRYHQLQSLLARTWSARDARKCTMHRNPLPFPPTENEGV